MLCRRGLVWRMGIFLGIENGFGSIPNEDMRPMVLRALKDKVRRSLNGMLIFPRMESLGRCVDRIRSESGFSHEELLRNFDLPCLFLVS